MRKIDTSMLKTGTPSARHKTPAKTHATPVVKAAPKKEEPVPDSMILDSFDFEALRRKKQRKNATGTTDLVAALAAISADIQQLKVGDTARIKIKPEEGKSVRSFIMSITTKLSNLTAEGREWAGRKYEGMADEDNEWLYVIRYPDEEPVARKRGGRKPKAVTAAVQSNEAAVIRH